MSTAYRTKLTSKDIYVLASLLKKEFVVGVEGLTLVQEIPFQREGIHFVVKSLEDRGLIKYELNGVLMVDPKIRYVMNMISDPAKVSMIRERGKKRKKQVEYRFYDKSGTVMLTRDPIAGCYEIKVDKPSSPEQTKEALESAFYEGKELICGETILLEELMLVKDYIKEFREASGREYLKNTVKNEISLDIIMEVLRGRGESVVVRNYERRGYRLELKDSLILVKTQDHTVKLMCENNVAVDIVIFGHEGG